MIEVFADIGCPFTHLGLHRFVQKRREAGRDDVRLWVRAWPLEIVNGTPLDPPFIAEEVADLRDQVAPDLFAGFDEHAFPASTLPAMALAAYAYEAGADVGERISLELRDLLFEQGVDVGELAVLHELAQRHDLDVTDDHLLDDARVRTDHAEGERRGVLGSPHFFTPDGGFFCPALDVERDDRGHLRIHADPEAFEAFVGGCLA
ncbi:MAG: DsbA family protein [Acidimicrobiia bacterium]|nr:DsbA family protein [Acidimicrobiia bacterium]